VERIGAKEHVGGNGEGREGGGNSTVGSEIRETNNESEKIWEEVSKVSEKKVELNAKRARKLESKGNEEKARIVEGRGDCFRSRWGRAESINHSTSQKSCLASPVLRMGLAGGQTEEGKNLGRDLDKKKARQGEEAKHNSKAKWQKGQKGGPGATKKTSKKKNQRLEPLYQRTTRQKIKKYEETVSDKESDRAKGGAEERDGLALWC